MKFHLVPSAFAAAAGSAVPALFREDCCDDKFSISKQGGPVTTSPDPEFLRLHPDTP
ncbi:hypothetical protein [Luteolibacter marinus]|uniref:hypothetical protein n=1 Tax=Luteolibacter marinus TaxID=2776705 RepID=UPI001868175B|nr:hypothetical protein [Luteolibacter marinus]